MMKETNTTSETNFQINGFYQRLIQMRQTKRKTFDSLSTPTHYALVEYEKKKREQTQIEKARNGLS
jgi:hypothetical protein